MRSTSFDAEKSRKARFGVQLGPDRSSVIIGVVTVRGIYRYATQGVVAAGVPAHRTGRIAGDRDIDLIEDRIGCNRMRLAGSTTRAGHLARIGRGRFLVGVNDPELLRRRRRSRTGGTLGEEVVIVAVVEPDFVRSVSLLSVEMMFPVRSSMITVENFPFPTVSVAFTFPLGALQPSRI